MFICLVFLALFFGFFVLPSCPLQHAKKAMLKIDTKLFQKEVIYHQYDQKAVNIRILLLVYLSASFVA